MNTIDMTINGTLHQFPQGYLPTWPEAQHIIRDTAIRDEDGRYVICIDGHEWKEDATDNGWGWLDNMSRILAVELFNTKVSAFRLVSIEETQTYMPTETISMQVLRTKRMWAHFKPIFDLYAEIGPLRVNGNTYTQPAGDDSPEANEARRKILFYALTGKRR